MKEKYIKYINSDIMDPKDFESFEDLFTYCSITGILAFDFFDYKLTKKICLENWQNQFSKPYMN